MREVISILSGKYKRFMFVNPVAAGLIGIKEKTKVTY